MNLRLLLLLLLATSACKKPQTEEERVKAFIEQGVRLAEERKTGDLVDRVSDSYTDNHGNDKRSIRAVLLRELLSGSWIKVKKRNIAVRVSPEKTEATLQLLAARGGEGETPGQILPRSVGAYDVKLILRPEGGSYIILSSEWEEVSGVQLVGELW